MSGVKNFGDKRNTAGFDKNPQNINKTGRNRKSFAKINESLEKKGIEKIKKKELIDFYSLVFNATEEELKKIVQDKNSPMALRYMIMELNDKRTRSQALKDFRDYIFGKAEETITQTIKARVLTPSEVKEIMNNLEQEY